MSNHAIEGRVLSPEEALPPTLAPAGPTLPPGTPDPPPWRTVAKAPPTPPPAPPPPPPAEEAPPAGGGEMVHRVLVEMVHPPVPPLTIRQRLLAWLQPWPSAVGATAALIPLPWTGHSAASTWISTVWYARGLVTPVGGYIAAAAGIACAVWLEKRLPARAGWVRTTVVRTAQTTLLLGPLGAIHWWDPIQILTGVPLS